MMISEGTLVANSGTENREGTQGIKGWGQITSFSDAHVLRVDPIPVAVLLQQELYSALSRTGYQVHRKIQVNVSDHVIILSGSLPSFYMRQVAIECVKAHSGHRQIIDAIVVDSHQLTS